jgi:hypothetical protein
MLVKGGLMNRVNKSKKVKFEVDMKESPVKSSKKYDNTFRSEGAFLSMLAPSEDN